MRRPAWVTPMCIGTFDSLAKRRLASVFVCGSSLLIETMKFWKSRSSTNLTQRSADWVSAFGVGWPYFSKRSFSREPALIPIRMAACFCLARFTMVSS